MKNFLHKKDYAPACSISRKYYNVFTTQQQRMNVAQRIQQQSVTVLGSSMILVFSLRHRQILYRNKIKSPE